MNERAQTSLFSWWRFASRSGAAGALSSLCLELARNSRPEVARFLAAQALDLCPESIEALMLFERLTAHAQRFELCARYQAFLVRAPEHPQSERILERAMDLLFEQRRYDAALRLVDHALLQLEALSQPGSQVPTPSAPATSDEWSELLDDFRDVALGTQDTYASAAE